MSNEVTYTMPRRPKTKGGFFTRLVIYVCGALVIISPLLRPVDPFGRAESLQFAEPLSQPTADYNEMSVISGAVVAQKVVADTPLDFNKFVNEADTRSIALDDYQSWMTDKGGSATENKKSWERFRPYVSDLNAAAAANTLLGGKNTPAIFVEPMILSDGQQLMDVTSEGLQYGDLILGPKGDAEFGNFVESLVTNHPDTPVDVEVLRGGVGGKRVNLTLTQSIGMPLITAVPEDTINGVFPLRRTLVSERGDSAGLMTALAYLDGNKPGVFTSQRVFGTGAIAAKGDVFLVDGADMKIRAAADEGATYFLLPADNAKLPEVLAAAKDTHLQLVPVSTLSEALTAVRSH